MARNSGGAGVSKAGLAKMAVLPNRRLPNVVSATGNSRVDGIFVDPFKLTYGARSPLVASRALLGQRFVIGPTFGVSGERSDQILKRMKDGTGDPRKTNAGIMYLEAGLNDIAQTSSVGPATFVDVNSGKLIDITTVAENTANNIKEMCRLATEAGMLVVVENEVGANGIGTAEKLAALMDLRQLVAEYGEVTPNVYVNDAFYIITNPTASAGGITLKPTYAYDIVTHPNALGAYMWAARSLAALLDRLIPPSRPSLFIQNVAETPANGRRQLLTNPLFATATGGTGGAGVSTATLTANTTTGSNSLVVTSGRAMPSGTHVMGPGIPNNTFINTTATAGTYAMVNAGGGAVNATATANNVTVTASIVPLGFGMGITGGATALIDTVVSADGLGNDVTVAGTFAGNGDSLRFSQALNGSSTGGGQYNGVLRAGDIVQAVAIVDITAPPVNLSTLYLSLLQNSGTGSTSMTSFDMFAANSNTDYGISEACTLWLATRPFALPAVSGPFPYVVAELRAIGRAAGSCNLRVRQLGVKRRNTAY